MAETFQDQEFLDFIIKNIVGHPEDVRIERTVDEMGVLLTLHINPEDMGYVIGRSGQTARSIRTLLKIVGAKHNARVNLKIIEPEGSKRYQVQQERENRAAASENAQAEPAPESEARKEEASEPSSAIDDEVDELDI